MVLVCQMTFNILLHNITFNRTHYMVCDTTNQHSCEIRYMIVLFNLGSLKLNNLGHTGTLQVSLVDEIPLVPFRTVVQPRTETQVETPTF